MVMDVPFLNDFELTTETTTATTGMLLTLKFYLHSILFWQQSE